MKQLFHDSAASQRLEDADGHGVVYVEAMRPDPTPASRPARSRKPANTDEYLAALPDDQRAALERLRKAIRAAAPDAEECLSYQLPAFRKKRLLVGFGATPKHCALYLMSSRTIEDHQDALTGYDVSKGTIRFAPDKPLPTTLVRKLVKARLTENARLDREAEG